MEEKLREIVLKIEQSKLSNDDKEALYAQISQSLHSVVVPVLLNHIPKDQLDALATKLPKDMVAAFIDVIKNSIHDGVVFKEISDLIDEILTDVETALQKGGIV